MTEHRHIEGFSHCWSGWPGAVCLDCGAPDQTEQCTADGCLRFEAAPVTPDNPEGVRIVPCTKHVQAPCPARSAQ